MYSVDTSVYQEQITLEEEGCRLGIIEQERRQRKARDKGNLSTSTLTGKLIVARSIEKIVSEIRKKAENKQKAYRNAIAYEMLKEIGYEDAVFIAICTMIDAYGLLKRSATEDILTGLIRNRLVDQLLMKKLWEQDRNAYDMLSGHLKRVSVHGTRQRRINDAMAKAGLNKAMEKDKLKQMSVAHELIHLIIEHTGLFIRSPFHRGKKKFYAIEHTSFLTNKLKEGLAEELEMKPLYLPMIIPPAKWDRGVRGGYVGPLKYGRQVSCLAAQKDPAFQVLMDDAEMPDYYRGINALQETAWKVDSWILDIMETTWNGSNTLCKKMCLTTPEKEPLPENDPGLTDLENKKRRAIAYWKSLEEDGKRWAIVQQLKLAQMYADRDQFYFVYFADFRGRIYCATPYLSPQYNDYARALLRLANGKRLGDHPEAVRHLKIEIANRYGVDKVPYNERIAWVDAHHNEILATAKNPFDNAGFWTEADKKTRWQFLQACREYQGFVEQGLDFISHIVCSRDGSNNGLQHYSMLLRDPSSAFLTNVAPSDRPQDIYAAVAEVVLKEVQEDYESSELVKRKRAKPLKISTLAAKWRGYKGNGLNQINRKLCKKPVMTLPYGAGHQRFFTQVKEYIKEWREENGDKPFFKDSKMFNELVEYIVGHIEKAIELKVPAAIGGMNYLRSVAKIMGKANLPICWKTPSGFPVHQIEYKEKRVRVETLFGSTRIRTSVKVSQDQIDPSKSVNGLPPNYVHSMDATHMVMTINACLKRVPNMSFAMIHDSFGTTAVDCAVLSNEINQQFYELYRTDRLLELRQQILDQIVDNDLKKAIENIALPKYGDFDPKFSLKSSYLFS